MAYDVIVAPLADEELDNILLYMSNDLSNPNAAQRFFYKIKDSIENLETFPNMYPLCELPIFATEHRKIIIDNYVIIYKCDETNKKVYVLRILYGKTEYFNGL